MAKQPDEGIAGRNREILRLRFEQRQPMTEIADRYGLSMASVKKILKKAVANGLDAEFVPDPDAGRPDRRRVLESKPISERFRLIGQRVWFWREITTKRDLREAALEIGMSDHRLRKIEQGVCRDLRVDECEMFADLLGLTLEAITDDRPNAGNKG